MKKAELQEKISKFQDDPYYNDFQIITSLPEWNKSTIDWEWGTEADNPQPDNKDYTVEVNFLQDNLHVTLVPTEERISGSVSAEGNWYVEEYIDEFFQELIENAHIFAAGRY